MDGFKSSVEIIILLSYRTSFFVNKHTAAEIITQIMDDWKISR